MRLPLILEPMVDSIGRRMAAARPVWVDDQPTSDDLRHIQAQVDTDSRFDKLRLRSQMLSDLATGKAKLLCKRAQWDGSKVLAIVYPGTQPDWNLWGRVLLAFGPSKRPWRIVWFAHPAQRRVPAEAEDPVVGPQHLNGGYAYPCRPETIVIYRKEEATRVLVHELLHASCTDDMRLSEAWREVLTETWAELFLVAVQARGSRARAAQLWAAQAQWIADQEDLLTRIYGVRGPEDYAWRYTVGRREVLEKMGVQLPESSPDSMAATGGSLRYTTPLLAA
jgi:hypothetical protein